MQGDERSYDVEAENILFLKQQYDTRIFALENEATSLREQLTALQVDVSPSNISRIGILNKIQLAVVPENTILSTPLYKDLKLQYEKAEQALAEVTQEKTRFRDELNNLKEARKAWEDDLHASCHTY